MKPGAKALPHCHLLDCSTALPKMQTVYAYYLKGQQTLSNNYRLRSEKDRDLLLSTRVVLLQSLLQNHWASRMLDLTSLRRVANLE